MHSSMMQPGVCAFVTTNSEVIDSLRRLHSLTGWVQLRISEESRWQVGRVVAPVALPLSLKMRACALRLSPGNNIQKQLYFDQTVLKVRAPFDRLEEDTAGRLNDSIANVPLLIMQTLRRRLLQHGRLLLLHGH